MAYDVYVIRQFWDQSPVDVKKTGDEFTLQALSMTLIFLFRFIIPPN